MAWFKSTLKKLNTLVLKVENSDEGNFKENSDELREEVKRKLKILDKELEILDHERSKLNLLFRDINDIKKIYLRNIFVSANRIDSSYKSDGIKTIKENMVCLEKKFNDTRSKLKEIDAKHNLLHKSEEELEK